jgi:histone-lysine N-methyltransferase SETMAR
MDKTEHRALIKFFVKEGLTPNEIHSKFIKVYGDSSPSFSTIKKWAAEFKRGRTSLEHDPREGCPKSATTPEIIEQVHDMVLDDQWMKVREIAETTGISKECVGYILHEELDMKKPCARRVPRLLTADQKRTRTKISEQCWEHFNKNKTDFVRRFITMDETWIHHYTLESKQQSKQWTEASCSAAPKKTRSVPSAGKVMASVFWDAEGILFNDYLEKGKTITGEYYSNLLTRLDKKNS